MNEMFSHINWLHVLVAAVAYWALGAVWYSPAMFAKKWQGYVGMDMTSPDAKKGMGQAMIISFILMLVCSIGIGLIAERMDLHGAVSGLKWGLLLGLCFSATAVHISYLYEKRPLGLHLINGLYNVVGCVVAAVIICAWR